MGSGSSKEKDTDAQDENQDEDVKTDDMGKEEDDTKTDDTTKENEDTKPDENDAEGNDDKPTGKTPKKLSPGAIAGIVIAIVVVIVIVVVVVVLLMPKTSSSTNTSGSTAISGSIVSSSLGETNTEEALAVLVTGQPNYPGLEPINGPFTTVIPTSSDATVFFVQNNNGDSFQGRVNGTSYPGGDVLQTFSGLDSSATSVTLGLIGYTLKTNSAALPVNPFVPFCQTYVINLPSPQNTATSLGIPFTLSGSASDYVSFVQNADIVANTAIAFGSTVSSTTAVTLTYVAGIVGLCRFNLIVAKVNTSGNSSGPILYAENITLATGSGQNSTNYTLKTNVTVPTGTIQWLAQAGGGNLLQEVRAIRQIGPNQVRLLTENNVANMSINLIAFRATTPPLSFTF